MAFCLKDVPKDVQFVWGIQMACEYAKTGVGKETFDRCQEIIKQYPEWFPDNPNEEIPLSKQRLQELNKQQ